MDTLQIFNLILYVLTGIFGIWTILCLTVFKKLINKSFIFSFIVFAIYLIVRFCFIPLRIKKYSSLSEIGVYLCLAILIALLIILPIVFEREKLSFSTKSLSYAGVCVAIAFALSFVKIEFLGGSITLASALPVIIYSYVFGSKKGVLVGIIFGVLQFIQKPTVYHIAQVVLDYPVAFGFIGLSGLVKNLKLKPIIKILIGSSIGLIGRYVAHVISGYFIFYIYAEGFSPFIYSVIFNMNVLVDLAIVLFLGTLLFSSKNFTHALEKISD